MATRGSTRTTPVKGKSGIEAGQESAGWLFTLPMIIILGVFLVIPVLMALYVSMTNWNGSSNPFGGGENAAFLGLENYTSLLTNDGLERDAFMQSIGNTFWYVIFVVPLQTITSLGLALIVTNKLLRAKGFFRTAFYFPSVTSSIAITTVFTFLFAGGGAVNAFLGWFGIQGPVWLDDPRGLVHVIFARFGVENPDWAQFEIVGRSFWEWMSGPSIAMLVLIILAVWTTTGTFMLMFMAALQDLPEDVDEAAALDGCTGWQKLTKVTIPQLRPVIFLVVTLGIIGTWQVFDQVYASGKGSPAGTTMTPAFLSYQTAFTSFDFGKGAAMSFVIFLIIVLLTQWQRRIMAEDKKPSRLKALIGRQSARTGAVR